jgi:hypothetical protein
VTGSWVTVTGKRRERGVLITFHDASPAGVTLPFVLARTRDSRQMSAPAERVCDGRQSRRRWMLALVDRSSSGDSDGSPAVPAVYRGPEGRPGPVLFTLDVDGERFAIRRAGDGGTAYDWLSGPNTGYGFGSSGKPNRSVEEHRESIRVFLGMIDPNTGYIGND